MGIVTNSLFVQTTLRFMDSALARLNNSVYLYDPSWNPSSLKDDLDTLPVVYLSVIKKTDKLHSQASKKRIILYQRTQDAPSTLENSFRDSVINVVNDNVVNDPVSYTLECLVPKDAISGGINTFLNDLTNVTSAMSFSANTQAGKSLYDDLRNILNMWNVSVKAISNVLSLVKKFQSSGSDYGVRSIKSMHRRRARIKFKSWESWETRDVVITDVQISKVGTEDDYYRATIDIQEMPVLYIGQLPTDSRPAIVPPALVGKTIKKAFETAIAVSSFGATTRGTGL